MSYATISPDGPLLFAWLDAFGGPDVTKLWKNSAQTTQSTAYHNWPESESQKPRTRPQVLLCTGGKRQRVVRPSSTEPA
jgi:hypothetical protein